MIDLWDLARSANFTEKELESFRVRRQTSALGSVGRTLLLLALCVPLRWLEARVEPPHARLRQVKPAQPWVCQP